MICPVCGQEIQEGHLYCEKCGREIRIVPDFEPEIENSIIETLTTVAEEIDGTKVLKETERLQKEVEAEEFFKEVHLKREDKFLLAKIGAVAAAVLAAAVVCILLTGRYSYPYQMKKAEAFTQEKNYEKAVPILEQLYEKDKTNETVFFLLTGGLTELGDHERAKGYLLESLAKNTFSETAVKEKIYDMLIEIYSEEGAYDDIAELLQNCPEGEISEKFQHYLALKPEYSFPPGTYEKMLYLKLEANTGGTIYYTLDGSTPDESSMVYTAPLLLEAGRYQVNAIFINEYHMKSEVVRNAYVIDLEMPKAPLILPESGLISIPTSIVAELPEEGGGTIYYTTDRSEPDENSLRYENPIEIPLGKSNYRFVIISEEGVKSEITNRSYDFTMNTQVTIDKAKSAIIYALIDRKVLLDAQGHAPGEEGKYVFRYQSIEKIDETYYYVFGEYYQSPGGSEKKEERLYAVEVYTGAPNRLIYDAQGQMGLIALQ